MRKFKGIIAVFLMILSCACVSCTSSKAPTEDTIPEHKESYQKLVEESPTNEILPYDFSKEHHYKFYKHQLRRANYTPEEYPQLYKTLEEARLLHIENGGPVQAQSSEVPTHSAVMATETNSDNIVIPIQQITALGSDDAVVYNTSGLSTVPGKVAISQVILGMYTVSGDTIGPASDSTIYGSGQDLTVETQGTLPQGETEAQSVLSYFYEDSTGTPFHGYIIGSTSAAPKHINNTNPVIKVEGNTEIVVCLGRSLGNCDYEPVGGSGTNVILPISGSIVFGGDIDPLNSDTSNASCLITLSRTESQGGGCMIKSTDNFFADPNTTISNDTLTWNLEPAHFEPASGCLQANADAIYTFTVMVNVNNLPVFVSITNAPETPPASPYYLKIPDMLVVFSCLPDGTMISMGDGTEKPVETIAPGDIVLADESGRHLEVHSTMRGKENEDLYVLSTQNGYEVETTKGHPLITYNAASNSTKPVLAKNLKVGDVLMTTNGPSAISQIDRRSYDGYVWNLVIDQTEEMEKENPDKSTYYANGVQVGDSYMQFKYGKIDRVNPATVKQILPEKWLQDYNSYLEK